LTVLLVNVAENAELVAKTVRARGYTVPVVLDSDREVSQAYALRGTPTAYLVDRDGRLLARAIGPRPWRETSGRALFDALLGSTRR
jgi:hypothetical protein